MCEFALPPLTFSPKLVCTPFTEMHDKSLLLLLRSRQTLLLSPAAQRRPPLPSSSSSSSGHTNHSFLRRPFFSTKPQAHLFPSIPKKTQMGSSFRQHRASKSLIRCQETLQNFCGNMSLLPQEQEERFLCSSCAQVALPPPPPPPPPPWVKLKWVYCRRRRGGGAPSQKKKEGRWVGMFPSLPSPLPGWRRRRRRRRWAYVHTHASRQDQRRRRRRLTYPSPHSALLYAA